MIDTSKDGWRFSAVTDKFTRETSIYRGGLYRLPDDGGDSWRHYWDGDLMVAVYDNPRYSSPTTGPATERVEYALSCAREFDQDVEAVLARLARRIEGVPHAGFVAVDVERDATLYALMWDASDPEDVKAWHDEIEAVYHGEVYRIEVEVWNTFTETWQPADDACDEFYGCDRARVEFEREFPLDQFPAELLVSADN